MFRNSDQAARLKLACWSTRTLAATTACITCLLISPVRCSKRARKRCWKALISWKSPVLPLNIGRLCAISPHLASSETSESWSYGLVRALETLTEHRLCNLWPKSELCWSLAIVSCSEWIWRKMKSKCFAHGYYTLFRSYLNIFDDSDNFKSKTNKLFSRI